MKSLKVTFRPEKRKIDGILIDQEVRLMADINCAGRTWGTPKIVLQHIDDYDVEKQKIKSGKKVYHGTMILSATQGDVHINNYLMKLYNAKVELEKVSDNFTVQDILHKAFPLPEKPKTKPELKPELKEIDMATHIINKAALWEAENVLSDKRIDKFNQMGRMVGRFGILFENPLYFKTATFDDLVRLSKFIKDEYLYKRSHPDLFINEKIHDKPKSNNTVAIFMKLLKSFYLDLKIDFPLDNDTKVSQKITNEQYLKDPIKLTIEELLHCVNSDYPEEFKVERDSFLYQCAIGQRVNDYYNTSQYDVEYNGSFFYINYDPSKTNANSDAVEIIETPLVKFAVEILKDNNMIPPIRHYKRQELTNLYNQRIKLLLKHWGITRNVIIIDGDERKKVPLWEMASNKLARSTFVDIIAKSQINPYLAGVHKEGSSAVKHYTGMDLEDQWRFFSMAFRQELY